MLELKNGLLKADEDSVKGGGETVRAIRCVEKGLSTPENVLLLISKMRSDGGVRKVAVLGFMKLSLRVVETLGRGVGEVGGACVMGEEEAKESETPKDDIRDGNIGFMSGDCNASSSSSTGSPGALAFGSEFSNAFCSRAFFMTDLRGERGEVGWLVSEPK